MRQSRLSYKGSLGKTGVGAEAKALGEVKKYGGDAREERIAAVDRKAQGGGRAFQCHM